jgi:hypothetical protein
MASWRDTVERNREERSKTPSRAKTLLTRIARRIGRLFSGTASPIRMAASPARARRSR